MKPWERLDEAAIPGGGSLRLFRRDREFSIRLGDGGELMNSRLRGSEEALARLGCAPIATRKAPQILIGGLGLGFTLRAALALLGPEARITVAELVPGVVAWGRGPMAELFAGCLDDPRTAIHEGDVGALMRATAGRWDAILLDVDNGPEAMVRAANDGLYGPAGLATARRALRPGGVLAVWSAVPEPTFTKSLGRAGFAGEEHRVHAHGSKGTRHVIWVARPK